MLSFVTQPPSPSVIATGASSATSRVSPTASTVWASSIPSL